MNDLITEDYLRDFYQQVPFNNFGKIFYLAGESFPEELGGNCVYMVNKMAKGFRDRMLEVALLRELNGLHAALLAKGEEDVFYLDPAWLHRSPLSFSEVRATGVHRVPTYFKDGSLRAELVNDGSRLVTSCEDGGLTKLAYHYNLDEKTEGEGEKLHDIRTSSKARVLRVLDEDLKVMSLKLSIDQTINADRWDVICGGGIANSYFEPEAFSQGLAKIERRVNVSAKDFMRIMWRSHEIDPICKY